MFYRLRLHILFNLNHTELVLSSPASNLKYNFDVFQPNNLQYLMSSKANSYPDVYEAIMISDELSSNQVFIEPKQELALKNTQLRDRQNCTQKPTDLQISDEYQSIENDPEVAKLNQIINGDKCDGDISGLCTSQSSPSEIHTTNVIKSIHSNLQSLSDEKKELFMQITIPTEETIKQYLVPIESDQITRCAQDIETFETVMGFISVIEKFDESPDSTLVHSPQIVFYFFLYLCQNRQMLLTKPTYAILVKALFHEYIVQKGFTNLITIYNRIFNDKLYADINNTAVFYPILTQEWIQDKIHDFQEKSKQIEYRKRAKRVPPKYEVAEIVGAKDKEGRWWMSKVLAVYDYQGHSAYYVEFLGWGDKFNEFIIDGFRIEKFNPKKHRYFRPAWRTATKLDQANISDDREKTNVDISDDETDIKDVTN